MFPSPRSLLLLKLTVLITFVAPELWADSFVKPTVLVAVSKNGNHLVRIDPIDEKAPALEARLFKYSKNRGFTERARFPVVGNRFPRDIYLSNEGGLVTVDSWFESGGKYSLAAYDENGANSRAYSLADLYLNSEILELPKTTSSTHWHCTIIGNVAVSDHTVRLVDKNERVLEVDTRELSVQVVDGFRLDCPYFLGAKTRKD